MQASVSPRALVGILAVAERTGLIAKKDSATTVLAVSLVRAGARHGGLGDAETEYEEARHGSLRSSEKVRAGQPYDQMGDLNGNLRAPTSPATMVAPLTRARLPASIGS